MSFAGVWGQPFRGGRSWGRFRLRLRVLDLARRAYGLSEVSLPVNAGMSTLAPLVWAAPAEARAMLDRVELSPFPRATLIDVDAVMARLAEIRDSDTPSLPLATPGCSTSPSTVTTRASGRSRPRTPRTAASSVARWPWRSPQQTIYDYQVIARYPMLDTLRPCRHDLVP